jgi:hypothetical protein
MKVVLTEIEYQDLKRFSDAYRKLSSDVNKVLTITKNDDGNFLGCKRPTIKRIEIDINKVIDLFDKPDNYDKYLMSDKIYIKEFKK